MQNLWRTELLSNFAQSILIANLPIEVAMQELAKVVVIPNEKSFAPTVFNLKMGLEKMLIGSVRRFLRSILTEGCRLLML
ncbi:hypothetical protein [Parageobacillus thermoglucosidasius]|uniref:hypothetical protein n=1 Tax=Parageobacillus thermoglucosidasius TaxID=1426 RepID=UPI000F61F2FC|nr:hypothetical protein [Parageobacillus thermoglucosidasius]